MVDYRPYYRKLVAVDKEEYPFLWTLGMYYVLMHETLPQASETGSPDYDLGGTEVDGNLLYVPVDPAITARYGYDDPLRMLLKGSDIVTLARRNIESLLDNGGIVPSLAGLTFYYLNHRLTPAPALTDRAAGTVKLEIGVLLFDKIVSEGGDAPVHEHELSWLMLGKCNNIPLELTYLSLLKTLPFGLFDTDRRIGPGFITYELIAGLHGRDLERMLGNFSLLASDENERILADISDVVATRINPHLRRAILLYASDMQFYDSLHLRYGNSALVVVDQLIRDGHKGKTPSDGLAALLDAYLAQHMRSTEGRLSDYARVFFFPNNHHFDHKNLLVGPKYSMWQECLTSTGSAVNAAEYWLGYWAPKIDEFAAEYHSEVTCRSSPHASTRTDSSNAIGRQNLTW